MSTPIKPSPEDTGTTSALANAEAQLATAAQKYHESGKAQFGSLLLVCASFAGLKETFKKTLKHQRPAPTWPKYVYEVCKQNKLKFQSERMADHYIALHNDIKEVGREKVERSISDGGYREVRSIVNELLGKAPKKETQANSAQSHLALALKELQAAEAFLPQAKLEIGSIKASIQKLLNGPQAAAPGKEKPITPLMPTEWLEKFTTANAKPDQVSMNAVVDELWGVLQKGGATGFPTDVTFHFETNDLGELVRRYDLIKEYMRQVKKSLGYNFAMPKPPAQTTTAAKSPKVVAPASSKATFRPKNVAEIALNLGSKSALGRAVGKSSKHADYWAKVNKLPAEVRPMLTKVFEEKKQPLDLSLIAITK